MSEIFTLEKIYKAYLDCQKGKKNTYNALTFELDRERNLLDLLQELQTKQYKISRYIYFIATYPTAREVFAAHFRDRVVHHLLYREIYDVFDKYFIPNSFANRIGKGTHGAVNKLRDNIKKVKKESGGGWYLKLDIQGFFRSIDKNILYTILEKRIREEAKHRGFSSLWVSEILWIMRIIIFTKPTDNFIYRGKPELKNLIPKSKSLFYSGELGLPIGNLTSQFFSNIYLDQLDHFITENLSFSNYVRYVDDFIIIYASKEKLKKVIPEINDFLQIKLKLYLHPGKIIVQETRKGIDFLGYFIKPTHTLVRQKVVKRFKNKLYKKRSPDDGLFSVDDIPMIQSYLGHFSHANSYRLIKKLSN